MANKGIIELLRDEMELNEKIIKSECGPERFIIAYGRLSSTINYVIELLENNLK